MHGKAGIKIKITNFCPHAVALLQGSQQGALRVPFLPSVTVCAEIITELILERAGSIALKTLVAHAIRNAIRANRFARIIRNWNPYLYSASGRFARITRISDSRESPDSRESCESIRANHATKLKNFLLEFMAFRLIPVICPAKKRRAKPENYWKRELISDRVHPAIKTLTSQKLIPGNIFPDPLWFWSRQYSQKNLKQAIREQQCLDHKF